MGEVSAPAEHKPGPGLIRCDVTGSFPQWLSQAGGSIILTTYQAGKVAMLGWDGRQVTMLARDFDKPMGLAVDGPRLALATRHELIALANAPVLAYEFLEGQPGRYDALYLPRASFFTGDVNMHDVAFGADATWFCNTRFSCLCSPSRDFSFVPRWRPPFVTETVPEDRCHLNGLAMADGRPRFVTALGESNMVGGWRTNTASGGIVIDVLTGQVVLRGLSMPHSPRLHEGYLWVLNSAAGELLRVDLQSFRHEVICTLPGYLRGLCFVGECALVGLCKIREKHIFNNLPVQSRFPRLNCGVAVVNLKSGIPLGLFLFTEGCTELYDVQFLPGILRPMILNSNNEAARQAFAAPEFSYWLRPSALIPET